MGGSECVRVRLAWNFLHSGSCATVEGWMQNFGYQEVRSLPTIVREKIDFIGVPSGSVSQAVGMAAPTSPYIDGMAYMTDFSKKSTELCSCIDYRFKSDSEHINQEMVNI